MFRMLPSSGHFMTVLIIWIKRDVTMQKYRNMGMFDTFPQSSITQYD